MIRYHMRQIPVRATETLQIPPKAKPYQITNATEIQNLAETPHREVWWLDLGTKNYTLKSIRQFDASFKASEITDHL